MIEFLIYISTNLFRTYAISRYLKTFFYKKPKRKALIGYSLFFLSTSICYLGLNQPWLNLGLNILGIFAIVFLFYDGNLVQKAIVTLLVYIISMACDFLAVISFAGVTPEVEVNNEATICSALFFLIVQIIISRINFKHNRVTDLHTGWVILSVIPVISAVLFVVMFTFVNEIQTITVAYGMGVLVINMIAFYLYDKIIEVSVSQEQQRLLHKEVAMYQRQLEIIMHSQQKIRSLQHDMKHHVRNLEILAERNEVQEIEDYVHKMETFSHNEEEAVYSGNAEIDSVLNYQINEAKRLLKDVDTQIKIPENLMYQFDLNVILGNLLDNAIEAAQKSQDKYLRILLELKKGVLFMEIENSFAGEIREKNHKLLTTKKEQGHGIGISNVRRIVEENKGTIDITHSENRFCVRLMLYV